MRTIIFTLVVLFLGAGCDETTHSNTYGDLNGLFKHIGDPCSADVPPNSQCGFPPQFYCSMHGMCASACNADADCGDGAKCIGAGDMTAGECRLPDSPDMSLARDGGHD